jgi:hypothetical protein
MNPHLVAVRILNLLEAPPNVIQLETTIAAFMFGRESVMLGLEPLAEMLGHAGQPKYAQRALKASSVWQARSGIQLCEWIPGIRNVRRPTEFKANTLNEATVWISQQLSNDSRQLPTLCKIDEHAKEAISKFLRRPLAAIQQQSTKTPTSSKSVPGTELGKTAAQAAKDAIKLAQGGFRVFPVDGKKPRVWKYVQAATRKESVICEWARRWPDTSWAILCGVELSGGGFLAVIDLDVHGEKFGNGFKTLALREEDLEPLPETFTVKTGGGGEHRYFRTSKPLPTSSRLLGPGLDCKALGGFVVAPGSIHASGERYKVISDLPIAWLPEVWESALAVTYETKRRIQAGERHDYLRGIAYAMSCQNKQLDEIVRTLRQRLQNNCEGGRTIDDHELQALASSAIAKISRAEMMLQTIVA